MTRLIDADSIYKWYLEAFKGQIKPNEIRFSMNDIRDNLENIPTVDAVPVKHGKWVWDKNGRICSVCGNPVAFMLKDDGWYEGAYCQQCGARMDEE